jgi:hypothetical protein
MEDHSGGVDHRTEGGLVPDLEERGDPTHELTGATAGRVTPLPDLCPNGFEHRSGGVEYSRPWMSREEPAELRRAQ